MNDWMSVRDILSQNARHEVRSCAGLFGRACMEVTNGQCDFIGDLLM